MIKIWSNKNFNKILLIIILFAVSIYFKFILNTFDLLSYFLVIAGSLLLGKMQGQKIDNKEKAGAAPIPRPAPVLNLSGEELANKIDSEIKDDN